MPKLKAKLLKHLETEIYCKIGVSKVHGVGVFALREIPKGAKPLGGPRRQREIKLKLKELETLPKTLKNYIKSFCFVDEDSIFIPSDGLNAMDMAVYLNHSKKPNLRFRKDGSLVALKTIRSGAELFIDYDISFEDEHFF
ncbi:MAG: SET domain-containing protein [Verrucomicrobia bacterium]|nr:MAG: SET domain-containing protein [Verrucomicrobiota bacterium]